MTDILRVTMAEPVIHGVLKLAWNDGYEGVLDIRPVIAEGRIFEPLQDPEFFKCVQLEEYGHSIFWMHPEGFEIDFGADSLRRDTEKQAKLHELIAS